MPASRSTAHLGSRPLLPAALALAAPESPGSELRQPPRHPALRGLLLLCLWLRSGLPAGQLRCPSCMRSCPACSSSWRTSAGSCSRSSHRRSWSGSCALAAAHSSCPGPGGGSYSVMSDAIIRIKDSVAAGASFLRAPSAVRDWQQSVEACCSEPRCSVAVVGLPRRPGSPAPALGCYLFNCTARGRSVCRFALHRDCSSYSLSRALEGQQTWELASRPPPRPRLYWKRMSLPSARPGGTWSARRRGDFGWP
ncbi:LDL receptor related protein 11 [Phyllostomus discolor]|uniref:LDL receptor related protein 11 n=1 Tax=Phyllostomus discolor TaxID=89673 RepID=A0A834ASP0_9CHIR|nr:LDL receptor related protein 11 [Phyllostomus discolor]